MRSRLSILAAGLVLCSVLCVTPTLAGASTAARTPDPNATLTWMQSDSGNFTTWDPSTSTSTTAQWAMQCVYDWLLYFNVNGRVLEPSLATSWKWNKKNTVLTFNLRHGVTFHDGSAFTASVAAQNVLRLKAGTGVTQLANLTAATAVNPYTLQLNFSVPNPAVLYYFTSMYGAIVSPLGMANPASLVTTPAGSGPYNFVSEDSSLDYTFTHWSGYWGNKAHVYPAQIVVKNTAVETTRVNAVLTGVVQGTAISGATYPEIANNTSLQISKIPQLSEYILLMNDAIAPLNNLNVRKAITMAIDRSAMKASNDGLCILGDNGAYPKGMTGYSASISPKYDPTKATQLIQKAGATGASVRMVTYQGLQPYVTFAQVAIGELDAIGLNASLVQVPTASVRPSFASGQYGIWVAQQAATSPDPSGITTWQSYPGFPTSVSPTLVSLMNSASQLPVGSAARQAAYVKVNRFESLTSPIVAAICTGYTIFIGAKNLIGLYTQPYSTFANNFIDYDLQVAKS